MVATFGALRRALRRWIALVVAALWPIMTASEARASGDEPPADYTGYTLSELMEMDVVYGASAHEQKVSEAPSAVTVITADDIRSFGYSTLAEVLTSIRGIYVTDDRNYSYLGVRGFNRPGDYSTRVLILVDGHRVNDDVVGQATVSREFPIDLDVIERIEVIRGPSSSLYGSNALFAVVNLVTRMPEGAQGLSTTGLVASQVAIEGRAMYGRSASDAPAWLIAGEAYSARGYDVYYPEFDSPATNSGVFENGDWERVARGYGKLIRGPLTVAAYLTRRDKGIPTASFGTIFNDDRAWTFDGRGAVDARYEKDLSGGAQLIGRLFYDWFDYHGDYPYDATPPGGPEASVVNSDIQTSQSIGGELRLVAKSWRDQRLVAGADFRGNLSTRQAAWDSDPYVLYLDDHRGSDQWALYAQDEVELAKWLRASLGLRYDQFESFGGAFSPRLALMVSVSHGTTLKGLYGRGFRAPSPYELYYNDGGFSQKDNPSLKPEHMASYELIVEHVTRRGIKGLLSAYRNRVEDLITQTTDPLDGFAVFMNQETIDARGVEAEIEGRLAPGVHGRMSYAFQEARDVATNALLTNSPQHLAQFNLRFPLNQDGLTGAVELLYMGSRRTLQGSRAGEHALTNVAVTYAAPLRPVQLSVTLRNLFDVDYGDPGSEEHVQDVIPRLGRTMQVRLSYQW